MAYFLKRSQKLLLCDRTQIFRCHMIHPEQPINTWTTKTFYLRYLPLLDPNFTNSCKLFSKFAHTWLLGNRVKFLEKSKKNLKNRGDLKKKIHAFTQKIGKFTQWKSGFSSSRKFFQCPHSRNKKRPLTNSRKPLVAFTL